MPTPEGVWTEFKPANAPDPDHVHPDTIMRPFSSEIAALRSATANGNRAIFVKFGETIEQAIARETPPPSGEAAKPTAKTGRSVKPELDALGVNDEAPEKA